MTVTKIEKWIGSAIVAIVVIWIGSFIWLVVEVDKAGGAGVVIEQGLIDIGKSVKHIGEEIDKD
jgi:hypothetical protein